MKLQAIQILTMYEALGKLADKELDLDTACIIAKNIKELAVSKEVIETKRNKIITEYAQKDENGNVRQLEDGNIGITDIAAFQTKMNDLFTSETEIDLTPVTRKALSEIKIAPKDILPIINMISEG